MAYILCWASLILCPITFTQLRNVHMYCNNSGVIKRIQTTSSCPYPRDALWDDYPIFAKIQSVLCAMPTMQFRFHHVKGHQKENADHFLVKTQSCKQYKKHVGSHIARHHKGVHHDIFAFRVKYQDNHNFPIIDPISVTLVLSFWRLF